MFSEWCCGRWRRRSRWRITRISTGGSSTPASWSARRSRIERRRLGISLPLEPEILIEKQQDELIQWLRKSEMNELLEELQARLTPLEKSVYHQYYEEDNSAADTADTLGIKRNTVNDAARRIRKKAAGLLFVTLLLCVQGGTFLIL